MNRTLVIGGTGTVGRQVLSQLSATGAQVRALTRRAAPVGLPSQVEVVPGNLTLRQSSTDGPIKTFPLRGIKDSPPYLHDDRLLTSKTPWNFLISSWS